MPGWCSHLRPVAAVVLCVSLTALGCGGSPATVSGTVTVDGAPLAQGKVYFYPQAGGATAIGVIDAEGRYRLKTGKSAGLEPGEYLVTVTSFTSMPSPMMAPEQVDRLRAAPAAVSSKKTSDLRYTVEAGGNVIDIALSKSA